MKSSPLEHLERPIYHIAQFQMHRKLLNVMKTKVSKYLAVKKKIKKQELRKSNLQDLLQQNQKQNVAAQYTAVLFHSI